MKETIVVSRYPELNKAKVGLVVTFPTDPPVTETVKPACENKNNGYWVCVTHGKSFQNQFDKDTHIGADNNPPMKEHTLAWMCWEHGLETP